MAGYDGFSRSNNAVAAEEEGRYPATTAAKVLGCRVGAIKAILSPCEWHHTSGWYNQTDYYDIALLEALATGAEVGDAAGDTDEEVDAARQTLAKLRAWRPANAAARQWTDCLVTWLEWSGTRKRPTATERRAEGATVRHAGGAFVEVEAADGKTFRKKIGARGFDVRLADGRSLFHWSGKEIAEDV